MNGEMLERLLTTLDVRLDAIAVCEIGSGWRLKVDPLNTVICHFAVRGHGFLEYAARRTPISAGTIIVVPPGTAKSIAGDGVIVGEISAPESCDSYSDGLLRLRAHAGDPTLILGCASLDATCGGAFGLFDAIEEPLVAAVGGHSLFAPAFDALLGELSEPRIGAAVIAECLMKQAVMFLIREQLQSDSLIFAGFGDRRTLPAITAMIRKPGEPHTIDSLARLSGMSRSSFADRFFKQYQKTPGEFLQQLRMRSAARLLATSPLPIKCLAAAVGYASRSQFSRAFKQWFGIDPTAYRSANRASEPTRDPALFDERLPVGEDERLIVTVLD